MTKDELSLGLSYYGALQMMIQTNYTGVKQTHE